MTENWQLISESNTSNNQQQLAHIIQYIFSDQFIYVHQTFLKQIINDPKGYVSLSTVAAFSLVQHFFDNLEVTKLNDRIMLIYKTIDQSCPSLIVKDMRVRRLCPFNANKVKAKPICIQRILEDLTPSDLRHYLGINAFATTQQMKPYHQKFILAYAPDYRKALENLKIINQDMPFRILNYQQLCQQKDRQSRFWEQRELAIYKQLDFQSNHSRTKNKSERNRQRQGKDEEVQRRSHRQNQISISVLKQANPEFNYLLCKFRQAQTSIE